MKSGLFKREYQREYQRKYRKLHPHYYRDLYHKNKLTVPRNPLTELSDTEILREYPRIDLEYLSEIQKERKKIVRKMGRKKGKQVKKP